MTKCHKEKGKNLRKKIGRYSVLIIFNLFIIQFDTFALARWSTIQLVPDADLLEAGDFISTINAHFFDDVSEGKRLKPAIFFNAGIKNWINIEAGFAGSFTSGIKAKILDESKPYLPSFTVGVRNVFYHRECWYFARSSDSLGSEIYFALGKSIEPIRLRFHTGLQSIPYSENDLINPFLGIEKYLGAGFYVTAEIYKRDKKPNASLFVVCKLLKNRLEMSAGLIDLYGMFTERDGLENSSFYRSNSSGFVRPGIWMGIRLNTPVKAIKSIDGKETLEEKILAQEKEIDSLKVKLDSLQKILISSKTVASKNSSDTNQDLESFVKRTIEHINALYNTEPFDPESIRAELALLEAKGEKILPFLYELALDTTKGNKICALAVATMGRINSDRAEELILKILKKDYNPELTIECLIALGKRETKKNISIIRSFTYHTNSDVAFTASEVLEKLEKESNKEQLIERQSNEKH